MPWHTVLILLLAFAGSAVAAGAPLLRLDSAAGVTETWGRGGAERTVGIASGPGHTTDGGGALHLQARSTTAQGNHYFGVMVPLPEPIDLRNVRLTFDARTSHPGATRAFYVRCYNRDEAKPAWSFQSWSGQLRETWRTFSLQSGLSWEGLSWEPSVVGDRTPDRVDRIEFIIGTPDDETHLDVLLDRVGTALRLKAIPDLTEPSTLVRKTVLVQGGRAEAVVLHPDSAAGRQAAAAIVQAIEQLTGVVLPCRPGTAADREPDQTAVVLGCVNTNPALLLLYARYLTPVDSVCPGGGGSLVHTVFDPFGKGVNAIVVGASDSNGLAKAARAFVAAVEAEPPGPDLALARLFKRDYSRGFLERFRYAGEERSGTRRLEQGLAHGRRALATGRHTSIAGVLKSVAQRYQLTGHSVEAKLFAALWDLYAESAVADPRKYGGPWGFDSDFPSGLVVSGWDVIEHDPALTDAERLRVVKAMGRWLTEAVIPGCAGAASSTRVPHNHQTFPGLGALFAGLYFTQAYDVLEGQQWLGVADAMFRRQAGYFKPYEDCNGYQWLTNGHLMRYAVARPDFGLFENGNGRRIIDYCIGTMNNLGYQVPYGDTGSWRCWNSELICLDVFAFVTRDPSAAWAADVKRRKKNTCELHAFYGTNTGHVPFEYNGVRVWPLEPQFYATHSAETRPPLEACFDKITFREAMREDAAYLLLDGLSNGGHKHLDGNSLPQLTMFGRIWLADNDYYKAQVKYHNSLTVFCDGRSSPIPAYAELLGVGESERYGYSRTRLTAYAGTDWERTVVWLKWARVFLVFDRVTARSDAEYQLRQLWHGVGAASLGERGLLLSQGEPSLWIQPAPGPELTLTSDADLGKNWEGYPHADPVVRSLAATATVRLAAGDSYVFATLLHGAPEGPCEPCLLQHVRGSDGVIVWTDSGPFGVGLGPFRGNTPEGRFDTDADVIALDRAGLSLLGVTAARLEGRALHESEHPRSVDLPDPGAAGVLMELPTRPPVPNVAPAVDAPPHPLGWQQRLAPEYAVLSANRGLPGSVDLGIELTSEPGPATQNVFSASAPNTLDALFDGKWANNTATSVMYEPDRDVTLTLDLGEVCHIRRVKWMQWWATTSSKQTSYLLGNATVEVSTDRFVQDCALLGVVTDDGPHPDFGLPREYIVDGAGRNARWVRLTLQPKPGSAIYLAQLIVEGRPQRDLADLAPLHVTRLATGRARAAAQALYVATEEGALLCLDAGTGTQRWLSDIGCRLNDATAGDLDGDGTDELVVARQDHRVSVLDCGGKELWSRELQFYRRTPHANIVRVGDIDGGGTREVIVGGENWRFHAFTALGEALWHYESVHPSRSGAVADLDGDGSDEVICGTHYYWASALNADGTLRWKHRFGPICHDIATGSFDGDRRRGVVFGGGDGYIHCVGSNGTLRWQVNTGDEVKHVVTADLDGDGRDEILAGSMSHSVYCFDATGESRWRVDLGAPVTALLTARAGADALVLAATAAGRMATLSGRSGRPLAVSELEAGVVAAVIGDTTCVVATRDGTLRALHILPQAGESRSVEP